MKRILIVGLPFFPHKYQYLIDAYMSLGFEAKALINDDDDGSTRERPHLVFAGKNKLKRIYSYIKCIFSYKPKNIDCYDYSILSIFYILVARLLKINVRYWLIGGELDGDRQNSNKTTFISNLLIDLKVFFSRSCLKQSDVIFAKERHHLVSIERIDPKLLSKVVSIYNAVPVPDVLPVRADVRKEFLYANAVIEKRNVIELIEAFSIIKKKGVIFSADIYGFNSISNEVYTARALPYSEKALTVFRNAGLEENVAVHGFVQDIKKIMLTYKFFVLPADIILANYALLEAMSFGLVPVVYPGDGYEELITDGVNGIVAHDYDLVGALERALSLTDEDYHELSMAAYNKVKNEFSMEVWKKKLVLHLC